MELATILLGMALKDLSANDIAELLLENEIDGGTVDCLRGELTHASEHLDNIKFTQQKIF